MPAKPVLVGTVMVMHGLGIATLNENVVYRFDSTTTTDTHGSIELRINVGHVWALEHCVVTGILAAMDYTFTTPD